VFKKNIGDKAKIVYDGSIIQGDKDFKSVLTSVKSANPDVIYFGGMYPEAALMVKQAREIGLNAIFLGGDGAMDQKLVEIAGPSAEGFYMTFTPDPANIESAKGFIEEYTKKYGEPGPYSIYAYVAADIMMKAINDTGQRTKDNSRVYTKAVSTARSAKWNQQNGDNNNTRYSMVSKGRKVRSGNQMKKISSQERVEMIDITDQVNKAHGSALRMASATFVPHTTAAVTNETRTHVIKDITTHMSKVVPEDGGYRHAEGNSDGHIKASLFGASQMVFVQAGRLVMGTWQGIYFCEFDGPRNRQVYVRVR
jgi:secondary thiamine-phosphate synthase enzyme